MLRATSFRRDAGDGESIGRVVLAHDERHLRRKALTMESGGKVIVDLPEPVALEHGDVLVLEDGRTVEVIAADEELYEIRADDFLSLARLAWHLGNRHLPTQIEVDRILIRRDHVIRDMLEGLGARVYEVVDWFQPVRGAYAAHGHHGLAPANHDEDDGHHRRLEGHGHPHDDD
jgi:urease accessory protein